MYVCVCVCMRVCMRARACVSREQPPLFSFRFFRVAQECDLRIPGNKQIKFIYIHITFILTSLTLLQHVSRDQICSGTRYELGVQGLQKAVRPQRREAEVQGAARRRGSQARFRSLSPEPGGFPQHVPESGAATETHSRIIMYMRVLTCVVANGAWNTNNLFCGQ